MRLDSTPLLNGKRSRDAQDDEYLDNYHSHKRYLTEVMASSLNGLTVGDSLSESPRMSPSRLDPMESPARTEISNFLSKVVAILLDKKTIVSVHDLPYGLPEIVIALC